MSNKLGSGFCALCGKEVPVVDGSVAAPVYGGELLSPQAVHEMGDNAIYSPVHAHCLEVAELKGELGRVYELVHHWYSEAARAQVELSVLHKNVEQSDNYVRKLAGHLNRACHIGLGGSRSENDCDELNVFLDFIQENNLLEW